VKYIGITNSSTTALAVPSAAAAAVVMQLFIARIYNGTRRCTHAHTFWNAGIFYRTILVTGCYV